MGLKIYLNGKLIDKKDARISIFDHGLLYGDGVFEGIRSYNRLIFKLNEHIDRLYESAHTIMLTIPISKMEMIDAIVRTLKANNLNDAYIRVVVTRGEGDLGLDPRKCHSPTIFIITDEIKLYSKELYENGLEIITVPTQRNSPEAISPRVKSLNYLNNILAKIEAINSGVEEAIMLNSQGYVAECTGDNIFLIKDGRLMTPPPYAGILKGITRDCVLGLAKDNKIPVAEELLTRHDLFNADESFLTGTAAEIIPVIKIDGRVVGNGKPGKITSTLRKGFRNITKNDGVRY